jgi:hypothetical protein
VVSSTGKSSVSQRTPQEGWTYGTASELKQLAIKGGRLWRWTLAAVFVNDGFQLSIHRAPKPAGETPAPRNPRLELMYEFIF